MDDPKRQRDFLADPECLIKLKSMAVILKAKNLNKVYPNGVVGLVDVNLTIRPGEFMVIIGASGAGKSTFLRCLNGLAEATSGNIFFDDNLVANDILHRSPSDRRKLAMIFQQFNLVGRHSVISNVLMGRLSNTSTLSSLLQRFGSPAVELAKKSLRIVGILEKQNMRADQLSGGQQQRVAIARALVQEPEILLADEPVASLDPVTSLAVMGYLKKINQEMGLSIVCNLHSIELTKKFASRVIALKSGRVLFDVPVDQFKDEMVTEVYGDKSG